MKESDMKKRKRCGHTFEDEIALNLISVQDSEHNMHGLETWKRSRRASPT
jgi:hypothetical protein